MKKLLVITIILLTFNMNAQWVKPIWQNGPLTQIESLSNDYILKNEKCITCIIISENKNSSYFDTMVSLSNDANASTYGKSSILIKIKQDAIEKYGTNEILVSDEINKQIEVYNTIINNNYKLEWK